jgi:hypothetical protein
VFLRIPNWNEKLEIIKTSKHQNIKTSKLKSKMKKSVRWKC